LKIGEATQELHILLTIAGSLGGGSIEGRGGGGGIAGCDAVSEPKETSPSSCMMAHIRSASAFVLAFCRLNWLWVLPLPLGRRGRRGRAHNHAPTLPAIAVAATSLLAAARVRRVAASAAAQGAASVGSVAIAASQKMAATAAWVAVAALEAAAAPFRASIVVVAVAAALAAVGAAAAAAFVPGSAGAGPPAALAHSLRSLAQAVFLFFSCSHLRTLDRHLTSRWSAVHWLPWACA
jgi:hypothetical protein